MPQEFQVLQCYSCKTFQVHIVKKETKWACKMCSDKQSIKKIFHRGSGKECRLFVQEINEKRIKSENENTHKIEHFTKYVVTETISEGKGMNKDKSKWFEFMKNCDNVMENTSFSDLKNSLENRGVKRRLNTGEAKAILKKNELKLTQFVTINEIQVEFPGEKTPESKIFFEEKAINKKSSDLKKVDYGKDFELLDNNIAGGKVRGSKWEELDELGIYFENNVVVEHLNKESLHDISNKKYKSGKLAEPEYSKRINKMNQCNIFDSETNIDIDSLLQI